MTIEGYERRLVANCQAALQVLANLIILDLMMPVMDGWAFRRAQRQPTRGVIFRSLS
jgi:CheY-like chemotaxis protein